MDTAAAADPSVAGTQRRRSRDVLLLAAAAVLTVSGVLVLIAAVLDLVDTLQGSSLSVSVKVASGMGLLSSVLELAAFAVAIGAFATVSSSRRAKLLVLAFTLFAAGALASVAGDILYALEFAKNGVPNKEIARYAAQGAADFALSAAAVTAAVAFGTSGSAKSSARRDGRLGWAAIVFAISFAFSVTSYILQTIFFSDFHAPGGLTGGLGVVAGGFAVNIGAAVLAAVALLLSRPRQARNAQWFPAREGLLGLAASVLALGFLIIAIGAMVYASSASSAGAGGKQEAELWLSGVSYLFAMFAAICAATGLLLSRGSARRDGRSASATASASP